MTYGEQEGALVVVSACAIGSDHGCDLCVLCDMCDMCMRIGGRKECTKGRDRMADEERVCMNEVEGERSLGGEDLGSWMYSDKFKLESEFGGEVGLGWVRVLGICGWCNSR